MAQYEVNLRDYVRILRKRKSIVLFSTTAIGLLSFVFAYLQRPAPTYKSVASVKIEQSGTMSGLYIETVTWNAEDYLATQAEIIKSFPIMEKVAKKLNYIDSTLSTEAIRKSPKYVNLILGLQSRVTAAQEGETNIIDISVITDGPDKSKQLANAVAEVYIAENTIERNKRAINALTFIQNQLKLVGERLEEAEESVRKFREDTDLITLEYEAESVLDGLKEAETKLHQLKREHEDLRMLLQQARNDQALPEVVLANFTLADEYSSLASLRQKLTELRLQKDDLLDVFTEKHPAVQEIDVKIEKIKRGIIGELKSLEESYIHKEQLQQHEVEQLRKKYRALPKSGLQLKRLQRRVTINDEVYSFLSSKRQEAMIQNAEKIEEATLVRPALEGALMNPPTSAKAVAFVGVFIGGMLGLVFAFIYETLDTSIGTIEDVEKYLELSVVGVIPFIDTEEIIAKMQQEHSLGQVRDRDIEFNAHLISHFAPKSSVAESYRALRTYLQYILSEKNVKSFTITSSSPSEGKSTTAVNLALTFAQIGKKTVLVDADLRKPKIATVFGLDKEPGLSNIILGTSKWRDTIKSVTDIMMGRMGLKNIIMTPGIDNLYIITAGRIPLNPSELLNSSSMTDLIAELENEYDVVILDTTPVLPASDAAVLARKTQGVLLVYKVGKVARGALKRAKTQIENVKANVLGIVLNSLRAEISSDYHDFRYGDYYAYGDSHGSEQINQDRSFGGFFDKITQAFNFGSASNLKGTMRKKLNKLNFKPILRIYKFANKLHFWLWFISVVALGSAGVVSILWTSHAPFLKKQKRDIGTGSEDISVPPPAQPIVVANAELDKSGHRLVGLEQDLLRHEEGVVTYSPYVLRLNQFESEKEARTALQHTKEKGFLSFMDLEYAAPGRFLYNVYAAGFASYMEAQAAGQILEDAHSEAEVRIQKRPFVISIRSQSAGPKSQEIFSALVAKGYFPYLIRTSHAAWPQHLTVVAIGAYADKAEAKTVQNLLLLDGFQSEIVVLARNVLPGAVVQN